MVNTQKKELNNSEKFEFEFLKLHLEFMNTFNLLDANLTLCIGWLLTDGAPSLAYPLVTKLSTHAKIQYLQNTVKDSLFADQTEMVEKLNRWSNIALKAKCQRNDYVHGLWHTGNSTGTLKIIFEPQFWAKSKVEVFSMDEFKTIVFQMKDILEQFHTLRDKYLNKYECGQRRKQIKDL